MKKNIKLILSLVVLLMIILSTSKVKAAIECNDFDRVSWKLVKANFTSAYQMCYDMRNPTSSLGNNNLDPHLSTARDYGAWAYLGMSAYGTNGAQVAQANVNYVHTTTNKTAIQDFCSHEIVAAKIVSNMQETRYINNIIENSPNTTIGMAIEETKGWYEGIRLTDYVVNSYIYKYTFRDSYGRYSSYGTIADTSLNKTETFRPVIWNK